MTDGEDQLCCIYELEVGAEDEYDLRHAEIWPEVVELIQAAGFYDYSIFRRESLVICVFRVRESYAESSTFCDRSEVQHRWGALLAPLFRKTIDSEGDPLWAERVFRLDNLYSHSTSSR